MRKLAVELGDRSYPIYIGNDLLRDTDLVSSHISGHQVLIVTNETVGPLYLESVQRVFSAFTTRVVTLPDGEQFKTLQTINTLFDALLQHHFERRCTLVALGGGVVGDMTGFAAACYQRGVPFIQIPTTLLAQVDSSVGGKTGVNHPLGKNMIGAFHQPNCVIIDTDTLSTLDDRQLSAGLAEIIKYGLIRDAAFFEWLEANMQRLLDRDPESLAYAIERSCQNKADIVAADEREGGVRALLNLGHTFGHAIEAATGYGSWLHGEAVGTGMLLAADLSARMGWLSTHDLQRVDDLIDKAQLPTRAPANMDYSRFLSYMKVDKKVEAGTIRLILLRSIGEASICADYPPELLEQTINSHHALSA